MRVAGPNPNTDYALSNRECPRFCVNAVPLVSASVVGASSFLLVTLMPRIVGIIWLARAAVKAERSEFISSLDGGPRQPYRFSIRGKGVTRITLWSRSVSGLPRAE